MTDFQNDMYRRYLASGQAEKAEAFRQAGADQRGAELAQTEAEVREAVELHVYCDMCLLGRAVPGKRDGGAGGGDPPGPSGRQPYAQGKNHVPRSV